MSDTDRLTAIRERAQYFSNLVTKKTSRVSLVPEDFEWLLEQLDTATTRITQLRAEVVEECAQAIEAERYVGTQEVDEPQRSYIRGQRKGRDDAVRVVRALVAADG